MKVEGWLVGSIFKRNVLIWVDSLQFRSLWLVNEIFLLPTQKICKLFWHFVDDIVADHRPDLKCSNPTSNYRTCWIAIQRMLMLPAGKRFLFLYCVILDFRSDSKVTVWVSHDHFSWSRKLRWNRQLRVVVQRVGFLWHERNNSLRRYLFMEMKLFTLSDGRAKCARCIYYE